MPPLVDPSPRLVDRRPDASQPPPPRSLAGGGCLDRPARSGGRVTWAADDQQQQTQPVSQPLPSDAGNLQQQQQQNEGSPQGGRRRRRILPPPARLQGPQSGPQTQPIPSPSVSSLSPASVSDSAPSPWQPIRWDRSADPSTSISGFQDLGVTLSAQLQRESDGSDPSALIRERLTAARWRAAVIALQDLWLARCCPSRSEVPGTPLDGGA